jgi:hypothetical protein
MKYGNCVHQINRPDDHPLGPDARSLYMKITCSERVTVRDYRATPSGRSSQTGKIFNEIFRISVAQLSIQTAYDHNPDDAQFYQARRSFKLSAYK